MKAVDKHPCYVGVRILWVYLHCPFSEVIFVLAKVCRGLISVRCLELRGVHFLVVQNVLVLW